MPFTTTIASGASLSPAIDLSQYIDVGSYRMLGIQMPSAWTAADLTFLGSLDGVTYTNISVSGSELEVDAAANLYLPLDPSIFGFLQFLKIRSGTSGSPVVQGALRTLGLNLVPVTDLIGAGVLSLNNLVGIVGVTSTGGTVTITKVGNNINVEVDTADLPVWGNITGTLADQDDLQDALDLKANSDDLATVATTGAYSDLSGKPTVPTVASTTNLLAGDNAGNAVDSAFGVPDQTVNTDSDVEFASVTGEGTGLTALADVVDGVYGGAAITSITITNGRISAISGT